MKYLILFLINDTERKHVLPVRHIFFRKAYPFVSPIKNRIVQTDNTKRVQWKISFKNLYRIFQQTNKY